MNLQQLAQQMERQKKLLAVADSLREQEAELEAKTGAFREAWKKEQADVERLQGVSLAALYFDLLGKKEERLEKEQREALAAAAKYRTAQAELESVQNELRRVRGELTLLEGCEQRYRQACDDRIQALKVTDSEKGPKILALEEQAAAVCAQLRELREAFHAGEQAQNAASRVKSELDDAEGWGAFDLLGGGFVADLVKHEHLDNAQQEISGLQACLRGYRTELADVQIEGELGIDVGDFLRFADWFFDGLFVDWVVQDRINDAQNRLGQVLEQISQIQEKLRRMETELEKQHQTLQEEIDALVIG